MRVCPKCNIPYPNSVEKCVRDQSPLSALQDFIEENAPLIRGNIIGEVIGNYKIHKKLGSGAMGTVYQGSHISIGKEVAVKILREDCAHNEQILERFFQEARSLAKLNHENIVQVLDFGCTSDGMAYLVTELLLGQSLDALLTKEKTITPHRAVSLLMQICRGLEAAHKLKIIHRDLKPDNIQLIQFADNPEFVKLLDFGIAKQLESNTVAGMTKAFIGTPAYMPPEQAHEIDERSDIYSLGVILYRMLSGAVPFEGTNMVDVLYKHLTEPPKSLRILDPSIPKSLDEIALRCLAKQKAQRFSSVQELAQALKEANLQSTAIIDIPMEDSLTEFDRTGPTSANPVQQEKSEQDVIFHTTHSGGSGELTFKKKPKSKTPLLGIAGVVVAVVALTSVILFAGESQTVSQPAKQPVKEVAPKTPEKTVQAEPEPPKEVMVPTSQPESPASQASPATQEIIAEKTPQEPEKTNQPEEPKNQTPLSNKKKNTGKEVKEKPKKEDPFGDKPKGGLE